MKQFNSFSVGNIVFAEDSAFVQMPYATQEELNAFLESRMPTEEQSAQRARLAFECVYAHIEGRLTHCTTQLAKNFATAKCITPTGVYWGDEGHFSIPTAQKMRDMLDRKAPIEKLTRSELCMALTALFEGRYNGYYPEKVRKCAYEMIVNHLIFNKEKQE